MKTTIFCFLMILATGLSAQYSISRNANLSLFGGNLVKQQNMNNSAYYYGVYGDCPIIIGRKTNFGIWGQYSASSFTDNMAPYKSTTSEMALGLNTGLSLSGASLYSFYGGLAVGYKNIREIGNVSKKKYESEGVQLDQLVVANVNLNLYNDATLLPRTQVTGEVSRPFSSEKTLSENGKADIIVGSWPKGCYGIAIKQSLADIPLNLAKDLLLQPKIGVSYGRYDAGYPESYALIGEISLKNLFQDDMISLNCQYKSYPGKDANYIVYGISINVMRILERK